jgi:hypothetical protein
VSTPTTHALYTKCSNAPTATTPHQHKRLKITTSTTTATTTPTAVLSSEIYHCDNNIVEHIKFRHQLLAEVDKFEDLLSV